ncbi:XdhC family protein [Tamlana flava]|uniref:XdhC family protein n=1 Tax=Tamlana flava TaxID=3158572 RepID=UPI00351B6FC1
MTHEFKSIVQQASLANNKGIKTVLASVVDLDGSSYRRPGVRMLVLENGNMVGAVSGGCVEKEVLLQSESVFKTGNAKIMTYDGRYRLGCEGVLYILLEFFQPDEKFTSFFFNCLENREPFELLSFYKREEGIHPNIGTHVKINDKLFSVSDKEMKLETVKLPKFKQTMPPCFKLIIIGAEHDAVQLCKYGALTGWEITVVSGASETKSIDNFPGANHFISSSPENLDIKNIDNQTAVVLMTHNFANDLRFLVALQNTKPTYIGLLGPTKRRDDLISQFLEYCPDVDYGFLDSIHGPAGLDIGSETPQEIAVSIISEILAYSRHRAPISLSKKTGKIHSK